LGLGPCRPKCDNPVGVTGCHIAAIPRICGDNSSKVARHPLFHPVRFIDDDEIPVHLTETGQNLLPLRKVQRRNDSRSVHPLVHAKLVANVLALENEELGVKFFLEFALPLKREICGTYDENSFGEAAQL
jgi:hypothetical protein